MGHLVLPWPLTRDLTDFVGGRWSKACVRRNTGWNRRWNRGYYHPESEDNFTRPLHAHPEISCLEAPLA
jgi:hypothetical protein